MLSDRGSAPPVKFELTLLFIYESISQQISRAMIILPVDI